MRTIFSVAPTDFYSSSDRYGASSAVMAAIEKTLVRQEFSFADDIESSAPVHLMMMIFYPRIKRT